VTFPDVYILGAPKAGTTSIAQWLSEHPDLYFCVPKEPYYWASDYPALRHHYGFDKLSSYLRLFSSQRAQDAVLRAEGSTIYLYSECAVRDILSQVPHPRFIVVLRNPVDLLVSYHRTQLVTLNETERDFATAWRRSLGGSTPTGSPLDVKIVDYPRVGRLGAAMERLMSIAPRDDVHVIMFDDLVRDPQSTWDALLKFLGLEPFAPSFQVRNASDKMYRSAVLRRVTHRPPLVLDECMRRLRQWSRTTDTAWVGAIKRSMWRREPRPWISDDTRREVTSYLSDDIGLLASVLKTDLTSWAASP
jgi:hypothetical protein